MFILWLFELFQCGAPAHKLNGMCLAMSHTEINIFRSATWFLIMHQNCHFRYLSLNLLFHYLAENLLWILANNIKQS